MEKQNAYKELEIKDYKDNTQLIDALIRMSKEETEGVYICGKSDFICSLFRILFKDRGYGIGYTDISMGIYDEDYGREYYLSLDGTDVIMDKAYMDNGKPYNMGGTILFYQEDCCQDLIDKALKDGLRVIIFGVCDNPHERAAQEKAEQHSLNYHPDIPGKKICLSTGDNGKAYGISASYYSKGRRSFHSYYTSEGLADKDIGRILKSWGF